ERRRDGPTHIAIGWRGLNDPAARPVTFDPASSGGVPAGMRTVGYRRPSWSDDGRIVFLGIGTWNEKPPDAKKKGTDGEEGNATEEAAGGGGSRAHDNHAITKE